MHPDSLIVRPRSTQGFVLTEVLVALLIFALGVLGLVALQSKAVTQSSQAQYRANASFLANELIGQMNLTTKTNATLSAQFASASDGPAYLAWKSRVEALLPSASTYPPVVTVTTINPLPSILGGSLGPANPNLVPSSRISIQMRWKHPAEPSAASPSSLQVTTEIK